MLSIIILTISFHSLNAIALSINYSNGMSDTRYYEDNIEKLSFTYGSGSNIAEIIGLEQFKNLKELWIGMTPQIKDYNFLRKLNTLEILVFQDITFSDIDFLYDMSSLKILIFQGCRINKRIDASKFPNLEYFEFTNSSLTEFPIEIIKKHKIEVINISFNNISNIPIRECLNIFIIAVGNPIVSFENKNIIMSNKNEYFFLVPEEYRQYVR